MNINTIQQAQNLAGQYPDGFNNDYISWWQSGQRQFEARHGRPAPCLCTPPGPDQRESARQLQREGRAARVTVVPTVRRNNAPTERRAAEVDETRRHYQRQYAAHQAREAGKLRIAAEKSAKEWREDLRKSKQDADEKEALDSRMRMLDRQRDDNLARAEEARIERERRLSLRANYRRDFPEASEYHSMEDEEMQAYYDNPDPAPHRARAFSDLERDTSHSIFDRYADRKAENVQREVDPINYAKHDPYARAKVEGVCDFMQARESLAAKAEAVIAEQASGSRMNGNEVFAVLRQQGLTEQEIAVARAGARAQYLSDAKACRDGLVDIGMSAIKTITVSAAAALLMTRSGGAVPIFKTGVANGAAEAGVNIGLNGPCRDTVRYIFSNDADRIAVWRDRPHEFNL